jgi:hypothetical protein
MTMNRIIYPTPEGGVEVIIPLNLFSANPMPTTLSAHLGT